MASIQHNRGYDPTRDLLRILEIAAWIAFCVGVLYAVRGFAAGGFKYIDDLSLEVRLVLMAPGVAFSFFAFLIVCWVQVSRANLDAAEATRDMLRLARGSDNGIRQAPQVELTPFSPLKPTDSSGFCATDTSENNLKRKVANFQVAKETIKQYDGKYRVASHQFDTLDEIRDFVIFNGCSFYDYKDLLKRSKVDSG